MGCHLHSRRDAPDWESAHVAYKKNQAPPIVHRALRAPGAALDAETQSLMESRFGHDFGKVRVHTDAQAAESAGTVDALAYTVGRDVVFGPGQYNPRSAAGQGLLAHELAHVMQQRDAAPGAPLLVGESKTQLERNAGEVTRSALGRQPGAKPNPVPVARAATAHVQRQTPEDSPLFPQLTLPQFGRPARPPRDYLGVAPRLALHLLPGDRERIEQLLKDHNLSVGPGMRPMYDGSATTIEHVVDEAYSIIMVGVPRSEIEPVVRSLWSEMVREALLHVSVPPAPFPNILGTIPAAPQPPGSDPQKIALTGATNVAWHVNLTGPRSTNQDTTLQLQIGEDAPLQRIFQVSYNLDNQQVQVVVGAQGTVDQELLKWLKLSGFIQVLAGVAWTGSPASGMLTVVQPSVGGQITATWHAVQFAVQASGSITAVRGQPPTAEFNITPQITIPFGSEPPRVHRINPAELTGDIEMRQWAVNASYSDIERMPTTEKSRYVRVLLGDYRDFVSRLDVDAVVRIWDSLTAGEKRQIRTIIERLIPGIDDTDLQSRLRGLIR